MKERGLTIRLFRGQNLKGHSYEHHLFFRKTNTETNLEQTNLRDRPEIKSRFGRLHEGWRGPWAAPCLQGVILRDRSTEGAETPPATGTALKKHPSDTNAEPTLDPEGHVPTLSRLYTHLTQLITTRQIHPRQSIQTSSHAHTDERIAHYSNTHKQRLRAVSRGTTWRWSGTPPPTTV